MGIDYSEVKGQVFVGDYDGTHKVYRFNRDGTGKVVYDICDFDHPRSVFFSEAEDKLYVAVDDGGGIVKRCNYDNTNCETGVATGGYQLAIFVHEDGQITRVRGDRHAIIKSEFDGNNPTELGGFNAIQDFDYDPSTGYYYILDVPTTGNCRIIRIRLDASERKEVSLDSREYVSITLGEISPPSQRIPVETYITTHINVYNPNNVTVEVTKKFVKVLPENCTVYEPLWPCHHQCMITEWDGRTCHIHIYVPERKGFEIDCDDVRSWPPDPDNPIVWLPCEAFWKGFVIIESPTEYIDPVTGLPVPLDPLEVVAVYNKESADLVDKITFRWWPVICGYKDTPKGRYKLYETYEVSVDLPFEPENITLQGVVKKELGIPDDPEVSVEIDDTTTYFDFLRCVTKERIRFKLQATETMWQNWLNKTLGLTLEDMPEWLRKPGEILEKKKKEKFCKSWQEVTVDPLQNIRHNIWTELVDQGIPPEKADTIIDVLLIKILDIDVGEGVGTSVDVEYIEPEIITVP